MTRNSIAVFVRRAFSYVLAYSLAAAPILSATSTGVEAQTQTPGLSSELLRADYEACQTQDEEAFRAAIEKITVDALNRGLTSVDYSAVVADQWRRGGMDEIVDTRVDIAVAEVRDKTSWGSLIQSLAYQEKAKELATAVAEHVYRSDAMKAAIETLAAGVSIEVGQQIEFASRDAAGPALKCLRAFLGPRYGSMVASTVIGDAGAQFGVSTATGGAEVTAGSVLRESGAGLTGAAILLVRRQLANLARNIGQRLVGSILSRLVSVVAGGVGLVLIAKDVWDLRYGVLPIIADEMKSPATKEKVREELAKTIAEQIGTHVDLIGRQSAQKVVEVWHDFRSAHAKALDLAERDDDFRNFLDAVQPEKLARLDEVVALILAAEGEPAVLRRLENGTLREAVNKLPEDAMRIARETRSLETAMKWSAIAGNDIDQVTSYGIYKTASPDDFTPNTLRRVLEVSDRIAVERLSQIDKAARSALFDLETAELKGLARSLNANELANLASYLTGLNPAAREQVLREVAKSPGKMQFLASERIRNAVVSSRDQSAAVEMMLRAGTSFDLPVVVEDFKLAFNGAVSPVLLVDKHPIALGVLAVGVLMLLLILRRMFTPRRPPKPPQNAPEAKDGKPAAAADPGNEPVRS